MYMYTLDDSEEEEFQRYLNMYNQHLYDISEEYEIVSEEYYYPILIILAAKNNDCRSYINEYLISY